MALAKCWGPRMLRAPWGCHGGGLGDRKLRRLGEEDMNPAVPISQTALSRARRQPPFGVQEAGGVCSPAVGTLAVPSVVNPIPWPLVGLEMLGWAAPSLGGCACCDQGPQADPHSAHLALGSQPLLRSPKPGIGQRCRTAHPLCLLKLLPLSSCPSGCRTCSPPSSQMLGLPGSSAMETALSEPASLAGIGRGAVETLQLRSPLCVSLCGSPGTHGTARAAGCGC